MLRTRSRFSCGILNLLARWARDFVRLTNLSIAFAAESRRRTLPRLQQRLLVGLGKRRDVPTVTTSTADVNSSSVISVIASCPCVTSGSLPDSDGRAIYAGSRV